MKGPDRQRVCPVCKEPTLAIRLYREDRQDGEKHLVMVKVECSRCGYTRRFSAHERV